MNGLGGTYGGNIAIGKGNIAGIHIVKNAIKNGGIFTGEYEYVQEQVGMDNPDGSLVLVAKRNTANPGKIGYSTALGFATAASATGAVSLGHYTIADGADSLAGGTESVAAGENSISFGNATKAWGNNSHALGQESVAKGEASNAFGRNALAIGTYSTAMGAWTEARGWGSTALGSSSIADGAYSLAAGRKSQAVAENSMALSGGIVEEGAINSAAIGKNARSIIADTVALGSNSVADRGAGEKLGYDPISKAAFASDAVIATALGKAAELSDINTRIAPKQTTYDQAAAIFNTADTTFTVAEKMVQAADAAYKTAQVDYDLNPTAENKQIMDNAQLALGQAYENSHYMEAYLARRNAAIAKNQAWNDLNPLLREKNALLAPFKSVAGAISVGTSGYTRQIIGVAAGSEDTDAVNVAQLKQLGKKYDIQLGQGFTIQAGATGTKQKIALDGTAAPTLTFDTAEAGKGLTVSRTGNTIQYGIDGTMIDLSGNSSITNVIDKLGQGFKLKSGTTETAVALDGTETPTVEFASDDNLSVKLEDKKVTYGLNKVGITTTLGDTFAKVDASNLTDENVTSWKEKLGITGAQSGTAASWMIADKNGTVTTIAKDGQVKFVDGKNTTVEVTKDADGKATVKVHMSDDVTFGKAGADGKDGHIGVNGKDGVSGVGIDGKDGISVNGKDGTPGVTIFGKDGVDGVNGAEGHIGLNGKDGLTDIRTGSGAAGVDGKNGETATRIVYKDPKGIEHQASTLDDGMKFNGDDGKVIAKKLNEQLAIRGGAKGALTTGNIGVTAKDGSLQIALAKELTGLASVTSQTVAASEKLVIGTGKAATTIRSATVTKGDGTTGTALDLGGARLTNVAAGTAATDAVTKGQVDALLGGVSSGIAGVEKRMNKTGAGAAALAALHPQDFDSDDKLAIAAGYGHYGNANALAVGAFYRPNNTTMVSVGGSFGGGENMLNVGVTMKVGKSNPYAGYSKAELVQTITSQNRRIEEIGKENRQLKEQMDEVMKQLAALQQK
ncbi:YadA-like family protein [Megasphaera vaginalis (ex Bordigoni et al. 2020)]|uniref:YadA-like family protein n=1 Tax=Megasphaera vaginalis (ex Bordigoni et al. 2020) TaxID=2045301 RepID=UPI000C7C41C6|nr:YadA-like family protein [Megasphaera vaginalis (ex Bordigoni et al. 2020)]